VQFRPTATIWFILLAPFLTLITLGAGHVWGLSILFVSHLLLVAVTVVPSLQGFGPVVTKYCTEAKTAWLTIDDGPDPETTPKVVALLEKYGARATFFLIGAKAAKYPELARMISDAGHTIGNHTQTHPQFSFWRMTPKALAREIDAFEGTINSLGISRSFWFRAPAGMKNPFLHPILAARGLRLIGWSSRAYDTRIDDCAKIVERIKRSVGSGTIILFHERPQPDICLKALERLLEELTADRFQLILPEPKELLAGRRTISWETA
jgi:peptidoglycan/xylan/chitin deacetylase (PgdA/CDA1 family)